MPSTLPTKDELFERFYPKVLQVTKLALEKHFVEDPDRRDDLRGAADLKFAELLDRTGDNPGVGLPWEESLEKSENLEKIEKYLHFSIYRAVLYEVRRQVDREKIVEIEPDSRTVADLKTYVESHVHVEDYFETPEDKILLKMFLRGDTTKQIADALCSTQKKIRSRMESLAMAIQADQARETRSTPPLARI